MVQVRVRSLNAANRVNPGLRRRFKYWFAANILSALILVPYGAVSCVHGIKMHDVALGERIIDTRVLRLDGPSGTCDVTIRESGRFKHNPTKEESSLIGFH